jgi:hypothetical protein
MAAKQRQNSSANMGVGKEQDGRKPDQKATCPASSDSGSRIGCPMHRRLCIAVWCHRAAIIHRRPCRCAALSTAPYSDATATGYKGRGRIAQGSKKTSTGERPSSSRPGEIRQGMRIHGSNVAGPRVFLHRHWRTFLTREVSCRPRKPHQPGRRRIASLLHTAVRQAHPFFCNSSATTGRVTST